MKNAIVVLLIILLSSVFLGSVNFSSAGLQTGSLATSYDEPTAAYTKTGNLSVNGLDYWWFSANAGDVLLIGIEADSYYSWTSALYYSNLTLIQTISDYNAHNHMFVATKTDNYLLVLSSGDNSFNYTIRHNSGSERMPTTLKFSLEPNPAAVGKAVTLQGNLTSNGNPIGSAQVTIKLGASTVGTLVTNSTGWFKASGSVGSAGTYNITVQYAGSE